MTAPKRLAQTDEISVLLVIDGKTDERLLKRSVAITRAFGSELEVYCPIVAPLAAHTAMMPELPSDTVDLRHARDRGRLTAGRVLAYLNEQMVAAHVETGICQTMSDGIVNAASRLGPDVVLLAGPVEHGLLEAPYHVNYDEIWSIPGAAKWVVNADARQGGNVIGLAPSRSGLWRKGTDAEPVTRATASVARRIDAEAHLLCCAKPLPALAVAQEAMAPPGMGISERRDGAMVRQLHELADEYGVPATNVHVHHGTETSILEQMIEPLNLGLVVASGRSERRIGGLLKRNRASELLGIACDLLVLGDSDELFK